VIEDDQLAETGFPAGKCDGGIRDGVYISPLGATCPSQMIFARSEALHHRRFRAFLMAARDAGTW